MKRTRLTTEQAQAILDAFEIQTMLDNEEEYKLLKENNPKLLEAYKALVKIADGR